MPRGLPFPADPLYMRGDMAPPPLLLLTDIRLNFGTTPLLAGAYLGVGAGERLTLVGRNG